MKTIDLHIHTNYSADGELSPKEIIELAERNGINVIAITDHNSISGIKEALEYANGKNITIIPGIEISCKEESVSEVHILGLFVNYTKVRKIDDKPSIQEAIKIIKYAEGIPILAHPGIYMNKMEQFIEDFIRSGGIGLEIEYPYEKVYGFSREKIESIKKRLFDIAKENQLLVSGGSDFHGKKRNVEIGEKGISKEEFERLKRKAIRRENGSNKDR